EEQRDPERGPVQGGEADGPEVPLRARPRNRQRGLRRATGPEVSGKGRCRYFANLGETGGSTTRPQMQELRQSRRISRDKIRGACCQKRTFHATMQEVRQAES